jgi:Domain of unknown function (DUF5615)
LAGKADREVRRFAIETDRILVTLDADFGNLIRFLRPVPLESFGCGLDHQPKQTFGQFLQNGSTSSARLIFMDNLPLSRKISFGSSIANFRGRRLPAHETVFAMTIHKSQASELGAVLFISPGDDLPILTQELIYIGPYSSRGHVEISSPESVLRAALAKRGSRTSGLRVAL